MGADLLHLPGASVSALGWLGDSCAGSGSPLTLPMNLSVVAADVRRRKLARGSESASSRRRLQGSRSRGVIPQSWKLPMNPSSADLRPPSPLRPKERRGKGEEGSGSAEQLASLGGSWNLSRWEGRGENFPKTISRLEPLNPERPPLPALSPARSGGEGGRRPGEGVVHGEGAVAALSTKRVHEEGPTGLDIRFQRDERRGRYLSMS
jgi:hypothetical protein